MTPRVSKALFTGVNLAGVHTCELPGFARNGLVFHLAGNFRGGKGDSI